MRKVDIVTHIADETDLTQLQAEKAVNAILQEIKDGLQRGEPVTLRRFGSFEVRAKRARMGRNPKTGEAAGIPARRVYALNRQNILGSRSTMHRTLKDNARVASMHGAALSGFPTRLFMQERVGKGYKPQTWLFFHPGKKIPIRGEDG